MRAPSPPSSSGPARPAAATTAQRGCCSCLCPKAQSLDSLPPGPPPAPYAPVPSTAGSANAPAAPQRSALPAAAAAAVMQRPPPLNLAPAVHEHAVLSRITLRELLHEQPAGREIVKLAHNETVADALAVLAKHNILAAPGARRRVQLSCRSAKPHAPLARGSRGAPRLAREPEQRRRGGAHVGAGNNVGLGGRPRHPARVHHRQRAGAVVRGRRVAVDS